MSDWSPPTPDAVLAEFEPRLKAEGETPSYLADLSAAFGRHVGDTVFLQGSVAGLDILAIHGVGVATVESYRAPVTEVVLDNGGSAETADAMVYAFGTAVRDRLFELTGALGAGGSA